MNATRALRRIRELARAGRVRFTDHAALRMLQRTFAENGILVKLFRGEIDGDEEEEG